MMVEMPELTVYRYEIFRPDQVQHNFYLFLAGVARGMEIHHFSIYNICTQAIEEIDCFPDSLFISRYGAGREVDGIPGNYGDFPVLTPGYPAQDSPIFTLAACH